jgi:hypothetical protein
MLKIKIAVIFALCALILGACSNIIPYSVPTTQSNINSQSQSLPQATSASQSDGFANYVGFATLFILIITLIYQVRSNRLTLQTQLLLNLTDQWNNKAIKRLRKRSAQNLLKEKLPNYELGDLLDFFSMICFTYKSEAINTKLLSEQFSWWIVRYWLCAKEWVQNVRSIDPDGWKSVEKVTEQQITEMERDGILPPSDKELNYFLKVEAGLFIEGS